MTSHLSLCTPASLTLHFAPFVVDATTPCRPSQTLARIHFMADCKSCVSLSSALVPPQSPAVVDMLTSLEVMSEISPSLPDLLQVKMQRGVF